MFVYLCSCLQILVIEPGQGCSVSQTMFRKNCADLFLSEFFKGLCEEAGSNETNETFIDGLLPSSSPLCQETFTTTVQIQTSGDVSSVYLRDKITEAFYTAVKPSLDVRSGVIAVAINEINERIFEQNLEVDGLQGDANQSIAQSNNNRTTIIIACSIVGACVLVCTFCLILIYLYEKRFKYGPKGRVAHIRFKNEPGTNLKDEEGEEDDEIVFLHTHEISAHEGASFGQRVATFDESLQQVRTFDESLTDEEYDDESDGDDDFSEFDIPPTPPEIEVSPCYNAPNLDRPAPLDEYAANARTTCSAATCEKCETERQMGVRESRTHQILSIESTGPVNTPMNLAPNTFTSPRIERYRLTTPTVENSRREYSLADDLIDL